MYSLSRARSQVLFSDILCRQNAHYISCIHVYTKLQRDSVRDDFLEGKELIKDLCSLHRKASTVFQLQGTSRVSKSVKVCLCSCAPTITGTCQSFKWLHKVGYMGVYI